MILKLELSLETVNAALNALNLLQQNTANALTTIKVQAEAQLPPTGDFPTLHDEVSEGGTTD
jgi:hypothetical protein